jgi:hypothetical protein
MIGDLARGLTYQDLMPWRGSWTFGLCITAAGAQYSEQTMNDLKISMSNI